jgi:hypothetical protein
MAKKKKIDTKYLLLGLAVIGGLLVLNDQQQKSHDKALCNEMVRASDEQAKRYHVENAQIGGHELNEDWEENKDYMYGTEHQDCN